MITLKLIWNWVVLIFILLWLALGLVCVASFIATLFIPESQELYINWGWHTLYKFPIMLGQILLTFWLIITFLGFLFFEVENGDPLLMRNQLP